MDTLSKDFQNITDSCRDLTGFSFPRRTPWAEEKYLSIIEKTKIKNIKPWAYIGGHEETFIEGQSFQLMLNVLERIPGLTDCELHLVSLSSQVQGQEEEKRQEALLPRLIKSLMTQKDLKRFAVYHSAEGQSQINISEINLSELVQSFQKAWVKNHIRTIEIYLYFNWQNLNCPDPNCLEPVLLRSNISIYFSKMDLTKLTL